MTDYKLEYRLGHQEFEAAMREVSGYPVAYLKGRYELWIDYRLEQGRQVAEKLFVDHERRRLTPRAPVHVPGTLTDDGVWQDADIDVIQRMSQF